MILSTLIPRANKLTLRRSALAAAALAAFNVAQANEGMSVRFSGFGTLGVVHSTEENADITSRTNQPFGAGHSRDWNFEADSRAAIQADAKFGSSLSGTAQLMAQQRYDNSYRPELMVGFLKWNATQEVALRGGRMPMPTFLNSDSRFVGYSMPTVRAPRHMYREFSPEHYDGADITWMTSVGNAALKSSLYYGKRNLDLPGDFNANFKKLYGINFAADIGDLTVRVSDMELDASLSAPSLDGVFLGVRYGFPANALGPGSPAIPGSPALADKYYPKVAHVFYKSIGVNYDPGRWFVTGEAAIAGAYSFVPRKLYSYITAGMRFGNFTPFVTLSRVTSKKVSPTGNPVLDSVLGSVGNTDERGTSLGVRWDVIKNIALKAQFDHASPIGATSNGMLTNLQPAYVPGRSYSTVSFSLDFVF